MVREVDAPLVRGPARYGGATGLGVSTYPLKSYSGGVEDPVAGSEKVEASLVAAPSEWGVLAQGRHNALAVGVYRPFEAQPCKEGETRRAREELHEVGGPPKERVAAGEVEGEGYDGVRFPRWCIRDKQDGATALTSALSLEVRISLVRVAGVP